jgi:transcriptional regulator with XRE-family HTH domain
VVAIAKGEPTGLATRIRELRNAKGLTQNELGQRVGLAHTYISRLEKGHITPTLPLLERLAKGLEVWSISAFHVSE